MGRNPLDWQLKDLLLRESTNDPERHWLQGARLCAIVEAV
jgi:hypothetical protein